MAKLIVIGCKLPHGLVLELPSDPSKKVEIAGLNKSQIIGAPYATTEIDAEFWEAWKLVHSEFSALKSGAIFEAKSQSDASAIAAEFKDRKTGFEPMAQDGKDYRAPGVTPASKE